MGRTVINFSVKPQNNTSVVQQFPVSKSKQGVRPGGTPENRQALMKAVEPGNGETQQDEQEDPGATMTHQNNRNAFALSI